MDPSGRPILTAINKLQKKKEIDIYVKRANNFYGMMQDALSQKSDSATKSAIKQMLKEYDKMYVASRNKLDYIAQDLAKATNVTTIGSNSLSDNFVGMNH